MACVESTEMQERKEDPRFYFDECDWGGRDWD